MNNKFANCLWFNGKVEEAADFYLNLFQETKRNRTLYFVEDAHGTTGDILTISLTLDNQEFVLLNGGPDFVMTPAISYVINCTDAGHLKRIWEELSKDGEMLMDLDNLPGVGLFGWLNDKYGVSWQLKVGDGKEKITPCFMFANNLYGKAKDAMETWIQYFHNGSILSQSTDNDGNLTIGEFELFGQHFLAMDSAMNHDFTFSMANSFYVYCEDQNEIDNLWDTVTKDGEEYPCGWMMDKFGVPWQTVARDMDDLIDIKEPKKALAVTKELYKMKKIDINLLRKVYEEN